MTTGEAQLELDELIDQRHRIENALLDAVTQHDSDGMIKHRGELQRNAVKQYATKAKLLGLTRHEHEQERLATAAEIERLEVDYETASAEYAEAIKVADALRIKMQSLGVRLFALDQRHASLRDERNEADAKQKRMIATWQENAFKAPNELACDLD